MATASVASAEIRAVVRKATADMLCDHWILGWGAGCFRYGFPLYAQKYPEIYYSGNSNKKFWEHAHDDLLEFPVEFGVVGLLPFAVLLASAGIQLVRRKFWNNAVALLLTLGCLLVLAHAWVDFVFQNPAVLLTWSIILITAVRWTELDNRTWTSTKIAVHTEDLVQPEQGLETSRILNPKTVCIRARGASSPS
jgi:O-antigen ligase